MMLALTGIHAQNQNISNGNIFEGEPFVAVNPGNPQNIVVAWMGFVPANGLRLSIKVRSSFDGGNSWEPIVTMPHLVASFKSADPSMAFDANGNLYLSYIDYQQDPDSGGVYLFKSVNGGLSWGNPILMLDAAADGLKSPVDRPWLSVNENGDRLYLTTKPAPWVPAPNRPYFTYSDDFGQSWQPWRYIDTIGYLVGNFIQAPMAAPAATGNIFYAAYPSYVLTQSLLPQYLLATSSDFGHTFHYNVIQSGNSPAANDSAKLAYKLLVNPSNASHLVFVYPYQPFGDIDIMMTETFTAGSNWTLPIRVNDDPVGNGKLQDMLWADFDQDGDLVISWRDRRAAAGSGFATASDYYATFRHKDSLQFAANFKLSDSTVSYHPILAQSGNDFMGLELTNDTISAAWGNTRDGSLDIWFARVAATTGQVSAVTLLESDAPGLNVYPNPSSGVYFVALNDQSTIDAIEVFDTNGKLVFSNSPNTFETKIDLSALPPGIYIIKVFQNGLIFNKKIVK